MAWRSETAEGPRYLPGFGGAALEAPKFTPGLADGVAAGVVLAGGVVVVVGGDVVVVVVGGALTGVTGAGAGASGATGVRRCIGGSGRGAGAGAGTAVVMALRRGAMTALGRSLILPPNSEK